jgi:single-strand DNA-binding protein
MTRDPELKQTSGGKVYAKFSLAVERDFKRGEKKEVDFVNVFAWGKTAENVAKYTLKGSKVCVDGRLQINEYIGKDGQKRTAAEVVANYVEFLNEKKQDPNSFSDFGEEVAF